MRNDKKANAKNSRIKVEKMINEGKQNKKRIIEISEREIKIIRNLIWEKHERLDYEKDNLDDPEYGVIYHIKNGLLQSLLDKYFYE